MEINLDKYTDDEVWDIYRHHLMVAYQLAATPIPEYPVKALLEINGIVLNEVYLTLLKRGATHQQMQELQQGIKMTMTELANVPQEELEKRMKSTMQEHLGNLREQDKITTPNPKNVN